CQITAEKYAPSADTTSVKKYAGVYAEKRNDNEVLINVWNFDPAWKVTVEENGRNLPVRRVRTKDPLHLISYEMLRLNHGKVPTKDFVTSFNSHSFLVKASSPASTLFIRVTDRFGNVYTQEMKRPKPLSCSMY
ncbi:MAG: calcineurin-like phosphoesterase C-terminal domain-containing protein, partial [Prevotella sp.]|nr:calcineurin-like phosphoesterase C-terminal domain-containing protein [Prevotella sp.]